MTRRLALEPPSNSVGNDEEWKAWKTIKPVFHPFHSSWKSLRDSHIPNASTAGDILIPDRAWPAFTQNQSHFSRKGLVNHLSGLKRKQCPASLTSARSGCRVGRGAQELLFRKGVAGRN